MPIIQIAMVPVILWNAYSTPRFILQKSKAASRAAAKTFAVVLVLFLAGAALWTSRLPWRFYAHSDVGSKVVVALVCVQGWGTAVQWLFKRVRDRGEHTISAMLARVGSGWLKPMFIVWILAAAVGVPLWWAMCGWPFERYGWVFFGAFIGGFIVLAFDSNREGENFWSAAWECGHFGLVVCTWEALCYL